MEINCKNHITQYIPLLLLIFVSGCASLPDATTDQIDNRRVEYVLSRHDTVPVVFEIGLMGKLNEWEKVLHDISKDTTTFAYNRPGYGKSDLTSTPRDGTHIVDELRTLLRSKGLNPPYVLVGHSLGGLYMQLFARRYPEEVNALILVDSVHPEQFTGKESFDALPALIRVGFAVVTSGVEKNEFNASNQTGESVLALPTFTGKPVMVLSASKPLAEKSELADDANEKRKDIARLYPGSKQIWVDSGHNIQREKPESIVAAIREVISTHP